MVQNSDEVVHYAAAAHLCSGKDMSACVHGGERRESMNKAVRVNYSVKWRGVP